MSDMIRFTCRACGKRLKAPREVVGRKVKCSCGQSHHVPNSESDEKEAPIAKAKPIEPRRRSRKLLYALSSLGVLVIAGAGSWLVITRLNKVSIEECCILDMVIFGRSDTGEERFLKAVALGVRTKPEADQLDLNDLELVARDGICLPSQRWYQIGKGKWIVFAVPENYAAEGGLRLRQKASGKTVELSKKIEHKKIDDIKKGSD